jgi:hypothetical protein
MKRKPYNLNMLLIGLCCFSFLSCHRMPLYVLEEAVRLDLELNLDLDLDLDFDMDVDIGMDAASIRQPEYFKALFYPSSGTLGYSQFVEGTGGAISTPPGTYELLLYAFGTEYIQIRGEASLETIEAFTSDISASKMKSYQKLSSTKGSDIPIVYTPDHLLVARGTVTIPELSDEFPTLILQASASSIVETYSFEVPSVIGAEYIESAEAYVTNQARSYYIGRMEPSTEPATIWFPVGVDRTKGCLYTVFNTFGKLPGESESLLHILIRDTQGQEYHLSTDITGQFGDPGSRIVMDEQVVVPPPGETGGGIAPVVDPWDDEIVDVPIG